MIGKKLPAILVVVNLLCWGTFLAVRDPLPPDYFAEKDQWLGPGQFHLNTADPTLVLVGRPIRGWSEWHGGERFAVKVLEVANLPSFVLVVLVDAIVLRGVPTFQRSILSCALLLALSSWQWYRLGSVVRAFSHARRGSVQGPTSAGGSEGGRITTQ